MTKKTNNNILFIYSLIALFCVLFSYEVIILDDGLLEFGIVFLITALVIDE